MYFEQLFTLFYNLMNFYYIIVVFNLYCKYILLDTQ